MSLLGGRLAPERCGNDQRSDLGIKPRGLLNNSDHFQANNAFFFRPVIYLCHNRRLSKQETVIIACCGL